MAAQEGFDLPLLALKLEKKKHKQAIWEVSGSWKGKKTCDPLM